MKDFSGRRVIVVDDNAHARAFLTQILAAVEVDVVPADSGPVALSMLHTLRFDAVFVDMFMRPMDGIELTREIRASKDPAISKLPVIMASAQASRDVVEGGMAAGVTGFIAKPFVPAAVLKRLAGAFAAADKAAADDAAGAGSSAAYL